MYRNLLIILICFIGQATLAQESGVLLSHYILDHFSKGTVHFKSGGTQERELNYNSLTSEMVFMDNGKFLAIAHLEEVDSVTVAGRLFVPANHKFYEMLTHTPAPLYIEYTCTIREPGTDVGYGMKTTTSATTRMKSLIQSGGAYDLKLPEDYQPVPTHSFQLFKEGKFFPANSAKQLSAVFPDKKAWISQYMKDKHPDLTKNEDLIALVQELQK